MAGIKDLITGSGSTGNSSLAYILLLTNVVALSVFLEKNLKISSKPKQDTLGGLNTGQDKKQEQPLQPEAQQIPGPESNIPHEKGADAVEEEFQENIKETIKDNIKETLKQSIKANIEESIKEQIKVFLAEKASETESSAKDHDKRPAADLQNEKVINFKEAVKEIKNKESVKESKESGQGSKEPLKTLVWRFPK